VPKSKLGRKLFSKFCYAVYRSYFVKKVNIQVNYKDDKKKRIITSMAKLLLKPIPAGFIKFVFDKLSTLFPMHESDTVYSICGSYGHKEYIPKKYLGEPVLLEFGGLALPVPEKWDAYLTYIYGDYMTPKKSNYV